MSDPKYSDLYLPITANPLPSRRKQPMKVMSPNVAGEPETPAKTQTMKIRGTGAATKGLNHSAKMG